MTERTRSTDLPPGFKQAQLMRNVRFAVRDLRNAIRHHAYAFGRLLGLTDKCVDGNGVIWDAEQYRRLIANLEASRVDEIELVAPAWFKPEGDH
jgi:hypothetical protein